MNKKSLFYPIICIMVLLSGCSLQTSNKLKSALEHAGTNRVELEKVLNHYRNDPEKSAAARFLIENMPGKYTKINPYQDSIKQQLNIAIQNGQVIGKDLFVDAAITAKWNHYPPSSHGISDLKHITADFLIENIDLSFLVWKKYPWNRSLSFDDFCAYILPYRIGDEGLSDWRKLFYEKYAPLLDQYDTNDVVEACNFLIRELNREPFYYNTDFSLPHLGGAFLFKNRVGSCREGCDIGVYAMRACGIPAAVDQYLYSPDFQSGHTWNVVRDTTGMFLPFWYINFEARRDMKDDERQKGKVYRHCYEIQPKPFAEEKKKTSIPAQLRNQSIKDVSANYFGENEVEITVDENVDYAMLGVFSPTKWFAVDIAPVKGHKATFRSIEAHVLFQPLIECDENPQPAGYPFVFDGKELRSFYPDTSCLEQVMITRKYPLRPHVINYMNKNLHGARIEGSKDRHFRHPVCLATIPDTIITNRYTVNIQNPERYQFVRLVSAKNKPIELAGLSFYEDAAGMKAIPAKIVESPRPLFPIKEFDVMNLCDQNPLTYFVSRDSSCQVVFDFGKETPLHQLSYIPRNDENFIVSGNLYELFYQNGKAGWKSLGRQEAISDTLYYSAPKGALLWIRNLTGGKEEQLFFYENGKQVFTCDLNYSNK